MKSQRACQFRAVQLSRSLAVASGVVMIAAASGAVSAQVFDLTLLHNNDGESKLRPQLVGGQPYAGPDRFVTVVNNERVSAQTAGRSVLTLSSGDNILPGPEFNASLAAGVSYDARVLNAIGYDALTLGNHDFDFGPERLADLIEATDPAITFLSANLDFTAEPRLQALVSSGRIAASKIVTFGGERVGIVGATTDTLPLISSPRGVRTLPVRENVQAEINRLTLDGVNKIVLSSHLQSISAELSLIPQLSGIDVVIAGGGSELLANPTDPLIPGDTRRGDYPRTATNFDGATVPVVTTSGNYRYLGRLDVSFNSTGDVIDFGGRAIRVSGNPSDPDAVAPDANVRSTVVEPVQNFVASLAANTIATSEVPLDGRTDSVRSRETNFGNLIADSLLNAARNRADDFGVDRPQVAIQNGGGIRNDVLLPAGNVSELDTFTVLPFANFVSVVQDVPVSQFKQLLENAAAGPGSTSTGRFAQVAGMRYTFDPSRPAQLVAGDPGNPANPVVVTRPGQRVIDAFLELEDGSLLQIIANGAILDPDLTIDVATIDFLARGGDGFPYAGRSFTTLGVTYQQALSEFITTGLNGQITAADYPVGGEGRISVVPEPTLLACAAWLVAGMGARRRRT